MFITASSTASIPMTVLNWRQPFQQPRLLSLDPGESPRSIFIFQLMVRLFVLVSGLLAFKQNKNEYELVTSDILL